MVSIAQDYPIERGVSWDQSLIYFFLNPLGCIWIWAEFGMGQSARSHAGLLEPETRAKILADCIARSWFCFGDGVWCGWWRISGELSSWWQRRKEEEEEKERLARLVVFLTAKDVTCTRQPIHVLHGLHVQAQSSTSLPRDNLTMPQALTFTFTSTRIAADPVLNPKYPLKIIQYQLSSHCLLSSFDRSSQRINQSRRDAFDKAVPDLQTSTSSWRRLP